MGGSGPLAINAKLAIAVFCMASGGVHAPVRQLLNPIELSPPSFTCNEGLRRSASTNRTFRPIVAKCWAMATEVNDLPSAGPVLVSRQCLG